MMRSALRLLCFVSGFVFIACCSDTRAQTNSWISAADGKWEDATNWSLNVAPASPQSVFITNASSKSVIIDAATTNSPGTMTVNDLTILAPLDFLNALSLENTSTDVPLQMPGRLTIRTGGTLLVTNSALQVGDIELSGGLSLVSGALRSAKNLYVGSGAGMGEVWAADSQLTIGGDTWIGLFGMGEMTMSNGTFLTRSLSVGPGISGSGGTLTVAGGTVLATQYLNVRQSVSSSNNQSAWLWLTGGLMIATNSDPYSPVEVLIEGRATVSNGTMLARGLGVEGTLTLVGGTISVVSTNFGVGDEGGTTGTVWITGGELIATNGTTFVATGLCSGGMILSNGTVRVHDMHVGYYSPTDGTLSVAGGNLLASSLNIADAGIVITSSTKGTVWVTGGQITVTDSNVCVGCKGTGQMTISNGTVVAPGMLIGNFVCSTTGTVVVTGGSLFATNAAHNAVLEVRSGTMLVNGGTVVIEALVITNACGHFVHSGGALSVGTLILDRSLDADGDGMPNGWEQAYGFDPLTPHANFDTDGDGLTDLQEFLAGTDPTNSTSGFRITALAQEGNDVRVTWMTGIGRTNALQATTDTMTNFTDIFSVTNTTTTVTNYLDAGAVTNWPARFYRVRLVP